MNMYLNCEHDQRYENTSAIAKAKMLKVFNELDEEDTIEVEKWMNSEDFRRDSRIVKIAEMAVARMTTIGKALRTMLPINAEFESETIKMPVVGDAAGTTAKNSVHIDEFIYDDETLDAMVSEGVFKKHYCVDCGSRNIEKLTYYSHSMPRAAMVYIFRVLLPSNMKDKTVLDLGSRLGAVVFGAYYLAKKSKVIGIERNEDCVKMQKAMIEKFNLDVNRIHVIHSDIMECADTIAAADVIIINTFDFFVDVEEHREMWRFFYKHFTIGAYVVMNRTIESTLDSLGLLDEMRGWLKIHRPCQLEHEFIIDIDDFDYTQLTLYTVCDMAARLEARYLASLNVFL